MEFPLKECEFAGSTGRKLLCRKNTKQTSEILKRRGKSSEPEVD